MRCIMSSKIVEVVNESFWCRKKLLFLGSRISIFISSGTVSGFRAPGYLVRLGKFRSSAAKNGNKWSLSSGILTPSLSPNGNKKWMLSPDKAVVLFLVQERFVKCDCVVDISKGTPVLHTLASVLRLCYHA